MVNDILFYLLSAVAVGAALALVCVRNPLTSAMCLLLTIVSAAGLFGLLDAWFLAIVQILVYAGAVVVLFLFVTMMVDTDDMPRIKVSWAGGVAAVISFLLVGTIFVSVIIHAGQSVPALPELGSNPENTLAFGQTVKSYGQLLFTKYMLAFQLTGVLLLMAMLGVIVLSKRMNAEGRVEPSAPKK